MPLRAGIIVWSANGWVFARHTAWPLCGARYPPDTCCTSCNQRVFHNVCMLFPLYFECEFMPGRPDVYHVYACVCLHIWRPWLARLVTMPRPPAPRGGPRCGECGGQQFTTSCSACGAVLCMFGPCIRQHILVCPGRIRRNPQAGHTRRQQIYICKYKYTHTHTHAHTHTHTHLLD